MEDRSKYWTSAKCWLIFVLVGTVSTFLCLLRYEGSDIESISQPHSNGEKNSFNLRADISRKLVQDVHHHNMYNTTNSTHHHHEPHKKPWMALEVVDGLRNEDVVLFVTATTIQNFNVIRQRLQNTIRKNKCIFHFCFCRIIPSSRTWMRNLANVFVSIQGK